MKKIISLFLAVGMLTGIMIPATAYAAEIPTRGFVYISPKGNDSNIGSIDKPVKTFKAAQMKARELNKSGQYPDGVTIYAREGTYGFSESLVLTAEDSNTSWRNYNDEKVTITGGVNLLGKNFEKVTDSGILSRLAEPGAKDKIYSIDLAKHGVTNIGDPIWPGAYSFAPELAAVGLVTPPKAPGSELLFNGKALTVARYPNEGYLYTGKIIEVGWNYNTPDAKPVDTPFIMEVADPRIEKWTSAPPKSILMYGFWKYDWADQTVPIRTIDPAKKTIQSEIVSMFDIRENRPFYVFNLLEELDTEGEYYIDRDTKKLYIIPPSDIKQAEITITLLEDDLIVLKNAENILISGFYLMGARNNTLTIDGGRNNRVTNCDISYTANVAASISGENNGITNSYVHDVEYGIWISGGDLKTLTPANNYAINNHIEGFSRITATYRPGIAMNGVGNIAAHNELHRSPHQAISFDGNLNKIMYNEIYDVLWDTDDSGAIYGGLTWVSRGTEIKCNYIHDFEGASHGDGVMGVYLDGGQCDMAVVGNVFENIGGTGVLIGGRDVVALNNIFVNCNLGVNVIGVMATVNLNTHHWPRYNEADEKVDFANNDIWKKTFPNFYNMMSIADDAERVKPMGNVIGNNVGINTPVIQSALAYEYDEVKDNFEATEDVGFMDFKGRNYTLKENSEVFKQLPEFKGVAFSRMGRIDDLAESRIQNAVVMRTQSPYSFINGEKVKIDTDNEAVMPFIENGRTYVPIRFIAESLGAAVDYKDGQITINTANSNLVMNTGSTSATKNGEEITLENMPEVVNNRTLVPLREVSELLDKKVYWNDMGLITISDDEALFTESGGDDEPLVRYIFDKLSIY